MPAFAREAGLEGLVTLEARRWDEHTNRSIISPTALSFLIPVLVVFFFAPFLCVFCIRKRRDTPVRRIRPTKLPALERSEARERLHSVAEVSNVVGDQKAAYVARHEAKVASDSESISEKECAICLSTLLAPSLPEPAKLKNENGIDEAAITPSVPATEQEEILRLKECRHEFHAECLISWVVLHKKSCPICRTVYYHEESEKPADVEAQATSPNEELTVVEPVTPAQPPVSNWHYFWTGHDDRQNRTGPGLRQSWRQFRGFRS